MDYSPPQPPNESGRIDGIAYHLWAPPGEDPAPAVIVFHGAGSQKENHADFARAALAHGFVALTLRWGGSVAAVYWIFSCLAVRSLDQHAAGVIEALRHSDLDGARSLVGQIVGRETSNMPETEITRAVFETVAENMSDGIVAPLFFLAIFGYATALVCGHLSAKFARG